MLLGAGDCPATGGGAGAAPGSVAAVCHPDEKRKFTIAELKRLGSFPDDFVLKGTFAERWERIGNSVPPLLMRAVAETLRDRVLLPVRARAKTTGRASHGKPRRKTGSRS